MQKASHYFSNFTDPWQVHFHCKQSTVHFREWEGQFNYRAQPEDRWWLILLQLLQWSFYSLHITFLPLIQHWNEIELPSSYCKWDYVTCRFRIQESYSNDYPSPPPSLSQHTHTPNVYMQYTLQPIIFFFVVFFFYALDSEVSHDFRGMHVKLSRAISKALFWLTQLVDLGCKSTSWVSTKMVLCLWGPII